MATPLRILVPVKRVIDYAVKPRLNSAKTAVETAGVKMSMNPFDELSIEESLRLRAKLGQSTVPDILAVSLGSAKSADTLRTAMAMGADRALLIEEDSEIEPLVVAKALGKVVEKENCNLVIVGKQSIDDDAGQTGQMLAGILGWPQAIQASKVEVLDGGWVQVVKEVDGGTETVKAKLPMVITTDLRLNEPRYASLPNIMKAKRKPIEKKKLSDFGLSAIKRLETLKLAEPKPRQGGGKVDSVDGLLSRLKELGAI